jgi:serine/threonine protein kinase
VILLAALWDDERIIAGKYGTGAKFGPEHRSLPIVSRLGKAAWARCIWLRIRSSGRSVALKVLPAAVVHDPGRMERFERETKAASALNHPNVAHL